MPIYIKHNSKKDRGELVITENVEGRLMSRIRYRDGTEILVPAVECWLVYPDFEESNYKSQIKVKRI